MTREEQIKKQADIYTDDASNYTEWSEDGGWSDTNDVELVGKAFIEGAEWADAHPKNVWHDASEKPHAKKWLLVQLYIDDYKILCLKDSYIDMLYDWCKIFNSIRWAYIDDLLPKGGER